MAGITCAARRVILARAQTLLTQLVSINENAARLETQLEAQGLSEEAVEITMNLMLASGGPPKSGTDVALVACTDDTVTDRLINILNINVSGGVDWTAQAGVA